MRTYLVPLAIATFGMTGCQSGGSSGDDPKKPTRPLELVDAPQPGDVAAYLQPLVAKANATHETLVVYVGATWCEPCQHFHDAARKHELDADLGGLRVIQFDYDRDDAALQAAGYRSTMLPLFALPGPDGRASGKQFEGSIKGSGAVAEIVPHLKALVGR